MQLLWKASNIYLYEKMIFFFFISISIVRKILTLDADIKFFWQLFFHDKHPTIWVPVLVNFDKVFNYLTSFLNFIYILANVLN